MPDALELDAVASLLKGADCGTPVSVRDLPGGWDNRNLYVQTDCGDYVLRQYLKTPYAHIAFELEVIEHLLKRGFATPQFYPSRGERPIRMLGGWPAVLFEFMPGELKPSPTLEEARRAASLLARFHLLTSDYRPSRLKPARDYEALAFLIRRQQLPLPRPGWAELLTKLKGFVERHSPAIAKLDALPTGVVHGDYTPNNIIWDSGGEGGHVIDFDLCHVAPFAREVADLIRFWAARPDNTGLDELKVAVLLEEYASVRPLGAAEMRALPLLLCLACASAIALDIRSYLDRGRLEIHLPDLTVFTLFQSLEERMAEGGL